MKITRELRLAVAAGGLTILGLAAGCADKEPPPPGVAVVGFVPDYCFWDGYEYVGWDASAYYYYSPPRFWPSAIRFGYATPTPGSMLIPTGVLRSVPPRCNLRQTPKPIPIHRRLSNMIRITIRAMITIEQF